MAGNSKIIYGNTTLIDLTQDTVTADKVLEGYTFHDKTGDLKIGTMQEGGGGLSVDNLLVTTPATKLVYEVGDELDITGLVVTAVIGRVEANATIDCTFNPPVGTTFLDSDEGYKNVIITYGGKQTSYQIRIKAREAKIYGVLWDGSSSTLTRTDSATLFIDPTPAVNNGNGSSPFDDIYPWNDMKIVEDANVGTLVSIPKYYFKWTVDNGTMKLQISEGEFEGSHVSPAHADRGDGQGERDVVYIGRYHCATSTYKSSTGVKPYIDKSRSSFRDAIHNLGTDIWQNDYAMRWTVNMLYLVEYANWDMQATIGMTGGAGGVVYNMGYTDSMTYHTGTSAVDRSTSGGTQYRHIEGWCDNCKDWCDGIYAGGYNVHIIKNPSDFADKTNGVSVGNILDGHRFGYIETWAVPSVAGYEWALVPSGNQRASSVTAIGDYLDSSSDYYNLSVGGGIGANTQYGAFCMTFVRTTVSGAQLGSRLMKLPIDAI